ERLPDPKVVRTTFFINTAAIAAALAMLLWFGAREMNIRSLNDQIADAQSQIDNNSKQNAEAIRLSKLFAEEERKIAEGVAFTRNPILISDFVAAVAGSLPKEISIDVVDARMNEANGSGSFVLRGQVAGTSDQATGTASTYVDTLKAHPTLGQVFEPITLEKLNRDSSIGMMSFEIQLKIKTEGKK
ncbi:MAG: hypothetical protein JNG83_13520, partial [Opitutaceae bacterium]|nr:hypothetical protein [Opitutaceae bacterium]